jgi:ubiquinone/menaquinone biosynthesis C-methylase UbiE
MTKLHSVQNFNLPALKESFAEKKNILEMLRAATGAATNDQLAIQISYDLQTGSYLKALEDPSYKQFKDAYCGEMAETIGSLQPDSILEAGIGEATTLVEVARRLTAHKSIAFSGFDISWSRCHYARRHIKKSNLGREYPIFLGSLESIPLLSDSFDLVFTAHAIEPNHGREREILRELYRVAQRYVVLFEPAFEQAAPEIRARMESHSYCRGLEQICLEEGWVFRPAQTMVNQDPNNPSLVLVIEKSLTKMSQKSGFACPLCSGAVDFAHGAYFCPEDGVVFPVIREIPCLLSSHAVVANKFID